MKYQSGEYEAVHQSPVWRDRSDFVFAAHLGVKDGRNEWEQLWGQRTGPHRFVLCCIPFFARDLALGDEVETDADFVLREVIRRSGQISFRVWFGGQNDTTKQRLTEEIKKIGPLMEWSSVNLLALSASNLEAAQGLAGYLHAREQEGLLHYETGNTKKADAD